MNREKLKTLRDAWYTHDWNGSVGPGELVLLLDTLLAEDAQSSARRFVVEKLKIVTAVYGLLEDAAPCSKAPQPDEVPMPKPGEVYDGRPCCARPVPCRRSWARS